jgi:hypothetical protein
LVKRELGFSDHQARILSQVYIANSPQI